ncbi:MAG: hypothetical protein QNJ54_02930 [Prochloraceae cyanobacterium]|nr:hypothetical protein [Prochloraceae cyanobacterium]
MNKFLGGFLRVVNVYAKIEIVGGLILVMFVGYLVFTNNRSNIAPSVAETSLTIQQ